MNDDTITVTGNVATHPEKRLTGNGTSVTSFRIASKMRRFDKATGQWVDEHTNWYSISAWRTLGEHVFRSLRKGDRVILTGRLRLKDWESNGKQGTSAEIDADAIGHDLRWGTTTFHKDSPPTAQQPETDSWATTQPGSAQDVWTTTPAEESVGDERPGELVAASGVQAPF